MAGEAPTGETSSSRTWRSFAWRYFMYRGPHAEKQESKNRLALFGIVLSPVLSAMLSSSHSFYTAQ